MSTKSTQSLLGRTQHGLRVLLLSPFGLLQRPPDSQGVHRNGAESASLVGDLEDQEDARRVQVMLRRTLRGNTGQAIAFIWRYVATGNPRDLVKAIRCLERELKSATEKVMS